MTIPVCSKWVVAPSEDKSAQEIDAVSVYEVEKENWCQLLIDYLNNGKLPMMLGIRQKSKGEHHILFTTMTLYIDALSLTC